MDIRIKILELYWFAAQQLHPLVLSLVNVVKLCNHLVIKIK